MSLTLNIKDTYRAKQFLSCAINEHKKKVTYVQQKFMFYDTLH